MTTIFTYILSTIVISYFSEATILSSLFFAAIALLVFAKTNELCKTLIKLLTIPVILAFLITKTNTLIPRDIILAATTTVYYGSVIIISLALDYLRKTQE